MQQQHGCSAVVLPDVERCSMLQVYVTREHWKVSPPVVCPWYCLEMSLAENLHEAYIISQTVQLLSRKTKKTSMIIIKKKFWMIMISVFTIVRQCLLHVVHKLRKSGQGARNWLKSGNKKDLNNRHINCLMQLEFRM